VLFLSKKLYLILFIVGNIYVLFYQYNLYHENKNLFQNGKPAICNHIYIGNRAGSEPKDILACDYYNEDLKKSVRAWIDPPHGISQLKKEIKNKDEIKILYIDTNEKSLQQVKYELKSSTIVRDCLSITLGYLFMGFIFLFFVTHDKNHLTKEDFMIIWYLFIGKEIK